jgi:hypothetical protein
VFTPEQPEALEKVVAQLPGSQTDLLKTLIGLMLININSSTDTVISSETVIANDQSIALLNTPDGAKKAIITCKGNPVLFRVDGQNPSASSSHYMPVNSTFEIASPANFEAISVDDINPSTLFITYY